MDAIPLPNNSRNDVSARAEGGNKDIIRIYYTEMFVIWMMKNKMKLFRYVRNFIINNKNITFELCIH